MTKVCERLFVGTGDHAHDLSWLTRTGISHIVNVAVPNFAAFPSRFKYSHAPILDALNSERAVGVGHHDPDYPDEHHDLLPIFVCNSTPHTPNRRRSSSGASSSHYEAKKLAQSFRVAISKTTDAVAAGDTVLLYDLGGISRGPLVAAAALQVLFHNPPKGWKIPPPLRAHPSLTLPQCIGYIRSVYPRAHPNAVQAVAAATASAELCSHTAALPLPLPAFRGLVWTVKQVNKMRFSDAGGDGTPAVVQGEEQQKGGDGAGRAMARADRALRTRSPASRPRRDSASSSATSSDSSGEGGGSSGDARSSDESAASLIPSPAPSSPTSAAASSSTEIVTAEDDGKHPTSSRVHYPPTITRAHNVPYSHRYMVDGWPLSRQGSRVDYTTKRAAVRSMFTVWKPHDQHGNCWTMVLPFLLAILMVGTVARAYIGVSLDSARAAVVDDPTRWGGGGAGGVYDSVVAEMNGTAQSLSSVVRGKCAQEGTAGLCGSNVPSLTRFETAATVAFALRAMVVDAAVAAFHIIRFQPLPACKVAPHAAGESCCFMSCAFGDVTPDERPCALMREGAYEVTDWVAARRAATRSTATKNSTTAAMTARQRALEAASSIAAAISPSLTYIAPAASPTAVLSLLLVGFILLLHSPISMAFHTFGCMSHRAWHTTRAADVAMLFTMPSVCATALWVVAAPSTPPLILVGSLTGLGLSIVFSIRTAPGARAVVSKRAQALCLSTVGTLMLLPMLTSLKIDPTSAAVDLDVHKRLPPTLSDADVAGYYRRMQIAAVVAFCVALANAIIYSARMPDRFFPQYDFSLGLQHHVILHFLHAVVAGAVYVWIASGLRVGGVPGL